MKIKTIALAVGLAVAPLYASAAEIEGKVINSAKLSSFEKSDQIKTETQVISAELAKAKNDLELLKVQFERKEFEDKMNQDNIRAQIRTEVDAEYSKKISQLEADKKSLETKNKTLKAIIEKAKKSKSSNSKTSNIVIDDDPGVSEDNIFVTEISGRANNLKATIYVEDTKITAKTGQNVFGESEVFVKKINPDSVVMSVYGTEYIKYPITEKLAQVKIAENLSNNSGKYFDPGQKVPKGMMSQEEFQQKQQAQQQNMGVDQNMMNFSPYPDAISKKAFDSPIDYSNVN